LNIKALPKKQTLFKSEKLYNIVGMEGSQQKNSEQGQGYDVIEHLSPLTQYLIKRAKEENLI